jgi:AraC-like DNA-binding protein
MMATQYISSDVVVPVLRALRELGADVTRFRPSAAGVGGSDADALMDAAAEQLGDEVGLRAAAEIPLGALGPVDYALTTSATVREGLHRLSRYYGVATERVELTVLESPSAGLELTRNSAAIHSRYWIEFSLALITERLRAAVGSSMKLEEVCFLHSAPSSASRLAHERFFGAPVRFGCTSDRLLFSPALLDVSLRTAAPLLAETLKTKLEEIEAKDQGDPIARRARKVIAELLGNTDVGVDTVAGRLAMSRRSFQRYLNEQGTSFRDLVDEIRKKRAERLLEERKLSTVEIAKELGFADTGAFFRAFRRWTGATPGKGRPGKVTRQG